MIQKVKSDLDYFCFNNEKKVNFSKIDFFYFANQKVVYLRALLSPLRFLKFFKQNFMNFGQEHVEMQNQ